MAAKEEIMQKHRPPGKRQVKPGDVSDGGLLKKDTEMVIRQSFMRRPLMDFEQIFMLVREQKPFVKRNEVVTALRKMDQEGKVKTRRSRLDKTGILLFCLA